MFGAGGPAETNFGGICHSDPVSHVRNGHVEAWVTHGLCYTASALSRKCPIILSGHGDDALERSPCGCGMMTLMPATLETWILFLMFSWAYFAALDKAHLHSPDVCCAIKTVPFQKGPFQCPSLCAVGQQIVTATPVSCLRAEVLLLLGPVPFYCVYLYCTNTRYSFYHMTWCWFCFQTRTLNAWKAFRGGPVPTATVWVAKSYLLLHSLALNTCRFFPWVHL